MNAFVLCLLLFDLTGLNVASNAVSGAAGLLALSAK